MTRKRSPTPHIRTIAGIDPGSKYCGLVVIEIDDVATRLALAKTLIPRPQAGDPLRRLTQVPFLLNQAIQEVGMPDLCVVEVSLGGWSAPRRHKGVNVYQIAAGTCIGALAGAGAVVWPVPVHVWRPRPKGKDDTLLEALATWPNVNWKELGQDAVDAAGIALWASRNLASAPSWLWPSTRSSTASAG